MESHRQQWKSEMYGMLYKRAGLVMSCTYAGLTGNYGHEPELRSAKKPKPNSSPFDVESTLLQLRPSCLYQYLPKCCILQFTNQGICLAQHYLSIPQTLPFMGETPPLKPPYPRPPFPNHVPHSPLYFRKSLARRPSSPPPVIQPNFLSCRPPPLPVTPTYIFPSPASHPPLRRPKPSATTPHTWGDGLHSRTDCLLHLLCH